MDTQEVDVTIERAEISIIAYSVLGTYLLSSEKHVEGEMNVKVWNPKTGEQIASYEWIGSSVEALEYVKWTIDESYMSRMGSKNAT